MLVLASQSPRRGEILKQAGIPFVMKAASVDESVRPGEKAADYVRRLAEEKACAVEGDIVLGADTAVVIDGKILGKPTNQADAARMLELLSGRRHEVITGICFRRGKEVLSDLAVTAVWLANLSAEEISEYVASGEPMDKAGAYAIQGLASKFIERIDGCYANVVGLPIGLVYRYLRSGLQPG